MKDSFLKIHKYLLHYTFVYYFNGSAWSHSKSVAKLLKLHLFISDFECKSPNLAKTQISAWTYLIVWFFTESRNKDTLVSDHNNLCLLIKSNSKETKYSWLPIR